MATPNQETETTTTANGVAGMEAFVRSLMKTDEPSWALHSSDQPGLVMVSSHLTSSNFLTWSKAMRIALGAKDKLGFINGKLQPPTDEELLAKWTKADQMIFSWILNAIGKPLSNQFLYFPTSFALWQELEGRFGVSSGPQIYKLQRMTTTLEQGDDTVTEYYGKLHQFWDEMDQLEPVLLCDCPNHKKTLERESRRKVNQFLMGLNEGYESLRSQILNLDPLPSVIKAYSMVVRNEQEKDGKMAFTPSVSEVGAMVSKFQKGSAEWKNAKKKEQKKIICEHCSVAGHSKDTCFKLVGVPEWYNELKNDK